MKFNCDCNYCRESSWPNIWKLNNQKLYCEIPKNASTHIKMFYTNFEVDETNSTLDVIKNYTSVKNETLYVVVRDPIERFMSLFYHYFQEDGGRYKKGVSFFKQLNLEINEFSVEERLCFILDNFNKIFDVQGIAQHHFYPQDYFVPTDTFKNIKYINIKNIYDYFPISKTDENRDRYEYSLNHNFVNVSTRIVFSLDQINTIKEIYKKDYLNEEMRNAFQ